MTLLNFKHPKNTIIKESDDYNGIFEIAPLEPGFGITIGNALRRVLLSSLEGYSVVSLKIEGITNEFSVIKGIIEDVTDIILNIKQITFQKKGSEDFESILIKINNQEKFKAGDINQFSNNFKVINNDLVICNMNKNITLEMQINVSKGRGYVAAEEHNNIDENYLNNISIDSIFTPIKNVKYNISNLRIGKRVDYEKLTIEISTNGSISPINALQEAADILLHHLLIFSNEKNIMSNASDIYQQEKSLDNQSIYNIKNILNTKLSDLDFSVRVRNCLKTANINTLSDLVQHDIADMLKFRNFGKKSLSEIQNIVKSNGLSFGMDVSKYIK